MFHGVWQGWRDETEDPAGPRIDDLETHHLDKVIKLTLISYTYNLNLNLNLTLSTFLPIDF